MRPTDLYGQTTLPSNERLIVLARFIDCFCLTMWCFTETYKTIDQAPVVQTLDSAIHRINHYPTDKCQGNQLRDPVDSDLSGG